MPGKLAEGVITRSGSPRCTWCRAALVASTAISPGPVGGRPSVMVGEWAEGYQLRARVGAPSVGPIAVFAGVDHCGVGDGHVPAGVSDARARRRSWRRCCRAGSGMSPTRARSSTSGVNASLGVTVTSGAVAVNSPVKPALMVSEKTRCRR